MSIDRFHKYCCVVLTGVLLVTTVLPARAQMAGLPDAGVRIGLSATLVPPLLKGVKVYRNDPFRLDFILDEGRVDSDQTARSAEGQQMVKDFLAALTTPEHEMWVNLSPYEEDKIVPDGFGQTSVARDLLAQDYVLKQLSASLLYPEDETGKRFWQEVYARAFELLGTTNIPVDMFQKVWIVPEKAVVYENVKAGTAYVVESHLKVMTDRDHLAEKAGAREVSDHQQGSRSVKDEAMFDQAMRDVVIPVLEKEVNEGERFARLRQIYHAMILARWFKRTVQKSLLNQVYVDQQRTQGVNVDDPAIAQRIWEQYVQAFKKGVYDYIKEDVDTGTQDIIPRRYFSGGFTAESLDAAMLITGDRTWMDNVKNVGRAFILLVTLMTSIAGETPFEPDYLKTSGVDVSTVKSAGTELGQEGSFNNDKGRQAFSSWFEANRSWLAVRLYSTEEWKDLQLEKELPLAEPGYLEFMKERRGIRFVDRGYKITLPLLLHETLHAAHSQDGYGPELLADLLKFRQALSTSGNEEALKLFYQVLDWLKYRYLSKSHYILNYLDGHISFEEMKEEWRQKTKKNVDNFRFVVLSREDIKHNYARGILVHQRMSQVMDPDYHGAPLSEQQAEILLPKMLIPFFIDMSIGKLLAFDPGLSADDLPKDKKKLLELVEESSAPPNQIATEFFAHLVSSSLGYGKLRETFKEKKAGEATGGPDNLDEFYNALDKLIKVLPASAKNVFKWHLAQNNMLGLFESAQEMQDPNVLPDQVTSIDRAQESDQKRTLADKLMLGQNFDHSMGFVIGAGIGGLLASLWIYRKAYWGSQIYKHFFYQNPRRGLLGRRAQTDLFQLDLLEAEDEGFVLPDVFDGIEPPAAFDDPQVGRISLDRISQIGQDEDEDRNFLASLFDQPSLSGEVMLALSEKLLSLDARGSLSKVVAEVLGEYYEPSYFSLLGYRGRIKKNIETYLRQIALDTLDSMEGLTDQEKSYVKKMMSKVNYVGSGPPGFSEVAMDAHFLVRKFALDELSTIKIKFAHEVGHNILSFHGARVELLTHEFFAFSIQRMFNEKDFDEIYDGTAVSDVYQRANSQLVMIVRALRYAGVEPQAKAMYQEAKKLISEDANLDESFIRAMYEVNGVDVELEFDNEKGIYLAKSVTVRSDPSQVSKLVSNEPSMKGGIDLDPTMMDLDVQGADGQSIQFNVDPALVARFQNLPGLLPVVIGVRPLADLTSFLTSP